MATSQCFHITKPQGGLAIRSISPGGVDAVTDAMTALCRPTLNFLLGLCMGVIGQILVAIRPSRAEVGVLFHYAGPDASGQLQSLHEEA